MKYFLVVGEASGDLHASNLMYALKQMDAEAEFRFFGGHKMEQAGGVLLKHYREMAYMGFISVLRHSRTILKNMAVCKEAILSWNPDVLILVDYAGFNLRIASYIKEKRPALPIHFYIAPKIWAWKANRIKQIKQTIDRLFVILPFEPDYFEQRHFKAEYVGNPCVDSVRTYLNNHPDVNDFRKKWQLDKRPVLALLPGSRKTEIAGNLPIMLDVARDYKAYQVVIAGAPGMDRAAYNSYLSADAQVVFDDTYGLLQSAYAAVVTSGTATLETALFNIPQVVCYAVKGGWLANWMFRHFMKVRFISLVNLIDDSPVVVELMGGDFTSIQLRKALDPLLSETDDRQKMQEGYQRVCQKIGPSGAAERTATHIIEALNKN
jgi:lipid-A-disaccharide synthase